MGVAEELASAKAGSADRNQRKLDRWLLAHPELEPELREAAEWFAGERSRDFGWARLAAALSARWDDFPPGSQHLQAWMQSTYPDLPL